MLKTRQGNFYPKQCFKFIYCLWIRQIVTRLQYRISFTKWFVWTVKLTKNADPDKYSYSGYGIGFNTCLFFSAPNFDLSKNVIIIGVDNSSSVHIDE